MPSKPVVISCLSRPGGGGGGGGGEGVTEGGLSHHDTPVHFSAPPANRNQARENSNAAYCAVSRAVGL